MVDWWNSIRTSVASSFKSGRVYLETQSQIPESRILVASTSWLKVLPFINNKKYYKKKE